MMSEKIEAADGAWALSNAGLEVTGSSLPGVIGKSTFAVIRPILGVKRLDERAQLPTYGTEGAACFDLYATEAVSLYPGCRATVKTGLAFDIPAGWAMMVYSRSGHGFKNGVRLANCTGVVDSDYTGEVMVKLANDSDFTFNVEAGERIAQAMLMPVQRFSFVEVDELKDTARGAGGFGSTGR